MARAIDYSERVVVVTGASSGIGRQVALDFARRRAKLALVARRGDRLREVAAQCGEAELLVGDLGDREFAASVVPRTLARFGRIDVLVNNAGIPKHKQIYDVSVEDLERTMRVNFLSSAQLALAVLPPMLRQGEGYIINVSSMAGRVPPPRETIYAASKYALTGFTEGLDQDLAGSNIHTAVLHVGPIDTEIWEKAAEEAPVAYRGRKYPPSAISDAVFRCIEKRRHEMTVPGAMRLAWLFKVLLPGLYRQGAARYDPVPREVVDRARRRAMQAGGSATPRG